MTVVYIDSLFLLNLIVDYLLLLATAKLAGEVICRPRLALGAAVGALYASAVFFPGMVFLTHPLCKLSAAIVMLLAGLGGKPQAPAGNTGVFGALLCLWRWNFCHWTAGGTGTHSAERHPLLGYGSEDHIALGGCLLCGTYIGVQQDCETLQA